jgi:hypothetical protein
MLSTRDSPVPPPFPLLSSPPGSLPILDFPECRTEDRGFPAELTLQVLLTSRAQEESLVRAFNASARAFAPRLAARGLPPLNVKFYDGGVEPSQALYVSYQALLEGTVSGPY